MEMENKCQPSSDENADGPQLPYNEYHHVKELQDEMISLTHQFSQMKAELAEMQTEKLFLIKNFDAKQLETENLKSERLLLKDAIEMGHNTVHPENKKIGELSKEVEIKKKQVSDLELQWDRIRQPLEEKKAFLEDFLEMRKSMVERIEEEMKRVHNEIVFIAIKIQEREEQQTALSFQSINDNEETKTRVSYLKRVKELTKNKKKLEIDLLQIINDTCHLQRENNSIQERLNRTYGLLDEMVFREAKEDSVYRQVYRTLTSIHQYFNDTMGKVLNIAREQHEIAEYEAKLEALERENPKNKSAR